MKQLLIGGPMATKALSWGENEFHEFWESEDHELLILRNHPEQSWTVHRHHRFLFASDSAEQAAEPLTVRLSRERVWKRDGTGIFGFVDCCHPGRKRSSCGFPREV
jgi:hypothetical protein